MPKYKCLNQPKSNWKIKFHDGMSEDQRSAALLFVMREYAPIYGGFALGHGPKALTVLATAKAEASKESKTKASSVVV